MLTISAEKIVMDTPPVLNRPHRKHVVVIGYVALSIPLVLIGVLGYFFGQNNGLIYLSWIGDLLLITSLISWRMLSGSLFSLYSIFLLSFYIFSYGQAFLRSLGLSYPPFDLYSLFDTAVLSQAQMFSVLGMFFMHLGALLSFKVREKVSVQVNLDKSLRKAVLVVAWVLFLFSGPLYFIQTYSSLKVSISSGYMALYNYSNSSFGTATSSSQNILSTLQMYFIPAVFLMLVSYKENVAWRRFVTCVIILAVLLNLMIGQRTDAGSLLVGFLFFWNSHVKTFSKRRTMAVILAGLALLVIFNVVGAVRGVQDKTTVSVMQTMVKSVSAHNPLVGTIGEMGGSMFPLISVMHIVPNIYRYQLGGTYISSLFSIFPNFLFGHIFNRVSLSNWLMMVLGLNYGPGFSLLAEAYYNFGWLGDIFMLTLGWTVVRLLYPFKKVSELTSALSTVMLCLLFTAARQDSLFMVRDVVYYALVPYLLIRFVNWSNTRNFKPIEQTSVDGRE